MKNIFTSLLLIIFVLSGGCDNNFGGDPVTTGTLLDEMTDLERLSLQTENSYSLVQFSSYDRRSSTPGKPGWFTNSDGFGNEPIPSFQEVISEPDSTGQGRYLVCDIEGPGAIVRTWTAMMNGTLRVWLDGKAEASFDGPAEKFLWNTPGALAGEGEAATFNGIFRQNDACYFPVPFSKGCRIEWTGDLRELHFYHIGIRRYRPGTRVETFSAGDLEKYGNEIEAVREAFSGEGYRLRQESVSGPESKVVIPPGQSVDLFRLEGPGSIESLVIGSTTGFNETILRQSLIRIFFDGSSVPQVASPLGDFFGAAPGLVPYVSLPFLVTDGGEMACFFSMPFRDSARVEIENRSGETASLYCRLAVDDRDWIEGRSMHFNARWRIDHDLEASNRDVQDIPYLNVNGSGRLVGVAAFIMNPSAVPSSWGNWWGEGDEKIFVDDDLVPSVFGTGSEDYFNYSWSRSDLFSLPYCGQPLNDGPANRGFVTNYRYHILDDIPFNSRLSFFMELYHHGVVKGLAYGRIAYYYALPGSYDDNMRMTDSDIRIQRLPAWERPVGYLGSANSSFYEAEDIISVYPADRLFEGDIWSGGRIIYYSFSRQGETIFLRAPVEEEGNVKVSLTMAKSPQSGKVRVYIEGQEEGERLTADLHSDDLVVSRNFSLNRKQLEKGRVNIVVENLEPGENRVGIDFVWIQK